MNQNPVTTRRHFLKSSTALAGASALAGVTIPLVHSQEKPAAAEGINVAIIGAGGRGTGAVKNALSVTGAPLKLVAMADVSESKLKGSHNALKQQFPNQVNVTPDQMHIGFDGYKKAIDRLSKGDIAIMTTPVAFRAPHFEYAMKKGVHIFMEKPLVTDGYTARRMFELGKQSEARKELKVAVGLMCRHCVARKELKKRIEDGAIGEISYFRTYRMQGPVASCFSTPRPEDKKKEILWQIERFHSFLWASGGSFCDYMIHNIDESCWMKDAWPESAFATGGRHDGRGEFVDQNFDTYHVEYAFPDGVRMFMEQRNVAQTAGEFASYVHGTKGMAVISSAGHSPAKCRIFKGQKIKSEDLVWRAEQPEPDPYQVEWDDFVDAIRQDKPYNEVHRSVEASLTCVMGRMSAHTGQIITREDALNAPQKFVEDVDNLTMDSEAPVKLNPDGKYPMAMPGLNGKNEYVSTAKKN